MNLRERLKRLEKRARQKRERWLKPLVTMTDEELCVLIAHGTSNTAEAIAAMSDADLAAIAESGAHVPKGGQYEIWPPPAPLGTSNGQSPKLLCPSRKRQDP